MPRHGCHAVAEVYPSLWRHLYPDEGRTPDQQDAFAVCRWLQDRDLANDLNRFFDPQLAPGERLIASIEGWILGVL